MPKINRKYYVRAKKIVDASINNVKSIRDFALSNTSSIPSTNDDTSSTNDVSLVFERD